MIETKGSFTQGRNLMKSKRAAAQKGITQLHRKERKNGYLTAEDKEELEALKKSVPVYSLSRNLPARYGGIVINSKLLKAFLKKLNGLNYVAMPIEDKIVISYENEKQSKGKLELYDQSKYFEEFNDIPTLVWSDSE